MVLVFVVVGVVGGGGGVIFGAGDFFIVIVVWGRWVIKFKLIGLDGRSWMNCS